MNRKSWVLRTTLTLLMISGLLASAYIALRPQHDNHTEVQCPSLPGICSFKLPDQRAVKLHFDAPPSALHPFLLQIDVAHAHAVDARFYMVGMDMGVMDYPLSRQNLSYWKASVILPVCVSGKRNWVLQLSIDGQQISIPFTSG